MQSLIAFFKIQLYWGFFGNSQTIKFKVYNSAVLIYSQNYATISTSHSTNLDALCSSCFQYRGSSITPQPRPIIVCNRLKKKSFSGQPQYPCCLSLPSRRPRGQLSVILSKLLTAFVIHLLSNNLENFSQKTTVPRSKEH